MPRRTIRQATERKLDSPEFYLVRYFIAFLNGDGEDMSRKAALAREKPSTEDMISHVEALVLARSGRLQERETDVRGRRRHRDATWSARTGGVVRSGNSGVGSVLRECGRSQTESRQGSRARQGPRRGLCRGVRAGRLGRCGSIAGSCRRPRKNFPEDTSVQYMYLPTLRALFSLNAHDPAAAIQSLQTASRFDLAVGGIGFNGFFGALYPIYVRGQATLRRISPQRPPPSSSGFSIIEASCSSIRWTRWRACSWRGRSLSRATPARRKAPTATVHAVEGRRPRSRWSKEHGRNTPGFSDRWRRPTRSDARYFSPQVV